MSERTPALFEVAGLRFARRGRCLLEVDTLSIERGRLLMLNGANGSGKTTLLKLLAGLLTAAEGRCTALGMALSPRAAARYCRGRHVYLHQAPYMFDASVEQNVAYGLRLRGLAGSSLRAEVAAALGWSDLAHLADVPARELSVGEQQRLALTRARILKPALLLLDEITANMDPDNRRRACELVLDLRHSGSSIVFASHHEEALTAVCDQHWLVDAGRVSLRETRHAQVIPLYREPRQPEVGR